MRKLTLRGVVTAARVEKIFSFESNAVNYGWKILDFRIMTNNTTGNTDFTAAGALGTSSEQFTFNDWDESQMVGMVNVSKENNVSQILDFDHVVVSNLFLSNYHSQSLCYIVVLEQLDISPKENIMYMLKERAQA